MTPVVRGLVLRSTAWVRKKQVQHPRRRLNAMAVQSYGSVVRNVQISCL